MCTSEVVGLFKFGKVGGMSCFKQYICMHLNTILYTFIIIQICVNHTDEKST